MLTREARAVAWRLSVAAGLVALLVVGTVGLNRAGVWIPWWVPVLAFAVIVIGALTRALAQPPEDDGDDEEPEIAGRIDPDTDSADD